MTTGDDLTEQVLTKIFSRFEFREVLVFLGVSTRWRLAAKSVLCLQKTLTLVKEWPHDMIDDKYQYEEWCELPDISETKRPLVRDFKCLNSSLETIVPTLSRLKDMDLNYYRINTDTVRLIAQHLPQLVRLDLKNCIGFEWATSVVMAENLQRLRRLRLSNVYALRDCYLEAILKNLGHLTHLNVANTEIKGLCLRYCGPNLTHLNILWCTQVNAKGLKSLVESDAKLMELSFSIYDKDVVKADKSLADICDKFVGLTHLNVSYGSGTVFLGSNRSTLGLSKICRLKNLESLVLNKSCQINDTVLGDVVRSCRKLKELVVDMHELSVPTELSRISPLTLNEIALRAKTLTKLEISYMKPRSRHIHHLYLKDMVAKLRNLQSLSLCRTAANDLVVSQAIHTCRRLTDLCVNGCPNVSFVSLSNFIDLSRRRPRSRLEFTGLSTGIDVGDSVTSVRANIEVMDIPPNISFKVGDKQFSEYVKYRNGKLTYYQ